uniref:(northern house mosquito) hypothetical protein n=1 Tax=Culex pipiens TaxID=7175 RepID=A0A8D8CNM8_CULPI
MNPLELRSVPVRDLRKILVLDLRASHQLDFPENRLLGRFAVPFGGCLVAVLDPGLPALQDGFDQCLFAFHLYCCLQSLVLHSGVHCNPEGVLNCSANLRCRFPGCLVVAMVLDFWVWCFGSTDCSTPC